MIDYVTVNEWRKFIRDNVNKVSIDDIEDLYKLVKKLIEPRSREKIDIFKDLKEHYNEICKDIPVQEKVKPKRKSIEERIIELAKRNGEIWVGGQFHSRRNYIALDSNDLGLDFIYIYCDNMYSDYYIEKFEWVKKLLRDNGYTGEI